MEQTSIFPHFVAAVKNWCEENGYKTYLLCATHMVKGLPEAIAKKHEHQLNLDISNNSSPCVEINSEGVEFTTRFNGVETTVFVPNSGIIMAHSPEGSMGISNQEFNPTVDEEPEIILSKPKSKLRIAE